MKLPIHQARADRDVQTPTGSRPDNVKVVEHRSCPSASRPSTPPSAGNMAEAVLLSIDLHKLMDHFAASGEPMSFEAVEPWLREMGFRQTDDRWIAEELSLMALDRSEFRILRRL